VRTAFRFAFHDFGWKMLSLAVAVVLWIFVANEPELAEFATAPVQFKGLPDGIEISSGTVESVTLELRGPSSELRSLDQPRRYAVVLDMSHVEPGERTFSITQDDVRLPRGIHLVRAIPSQLRFDFERRASRPIPVDVRFGPPPPGYEVTGFSVTPRTLRIVGPHSRVEQMKAAVTDPIDVSQVVGPAEFHVTAYVEDSHVRLASPPQVTVNVEVRARPSGPVPGVPGRR
jgi:YbbR domain-containing protein